MGGMEDTLMRISMQAKILILITALLLCVTILLTAIFSYLQLKETEKEMGTLALNAAKTISLMPTVKNAFKKEHPEEVIQPISEEMRELIGAEFIVIGNTDSIRYAHPDKNKLGKKMVGGDNDKALLHGEYYTSRAEGSLGPSLRGKAPIYDETGEIIGLVSVGFMVEDIKSIIWNKVFKISGSAFGVLLLGIIGSLLLAQNIRKDTLGLEPHQIGSLYRDRNAILASIKEGVIAIDVQGNINMLNESAKNILGISAINDKKIEEIVPNTKMYEVLSSGQPIKDDELILNNRSVIVNRIPIKNEKDEIVGVVSSFRDKTEINEMLTTLSEIRSYSQDLRAQTHEFTNKLYVLSGLLQLEHYEEAIDLIQSESDNSIHQNKVLNEQVQDKTVQALLLGKISKCSEKKIEFKIDHNTYLNELPIHFDVVKLIAILGNLIDNAIEAVESSSKKEIHFFATDVGDDIVFEIADSGTGIPEEDVSNIFLQGYSTKQNGHRGFGLNIVKEAVSKLNGDIEFNNSDEGAVFSVFFPKELQ